MFKLNIDHFNAIRKGPWETVDKTDYRLFTDHETRTIHLIGQSSQKNDWPDNFDFRAVAFAPAEEWFPGKGILVHSGFLRQYKAVRNILLDAAYENPDYAIRVAGYSLGGTWTQIFVQDILHRWPDRDILCVAYAPGNPWRKLPGKYKKLLRNSITFVSCYWDPVTWMIVLRFFRYGHDLKIGKLWRMLPFQHLPDQIIRALEERRDT